MANEVLTSLFGLNAYDTARKYEAEQEARDLQFAQLDPRQQIVMMGSRAGRQLSKGLNELFGIVPPELQKVRNIEDAMKEVQTSGLDLTDPTVMYPAMAKALSSRGLDREATMVMMEYQKSLPDYLKATAANKKAEQVKSSGVQEERDRAAIVKANAKVKAGVELDPEEEAYVRDIYEKWGTGYQKIQGDYVVDVPPKRLDVIVPELTKYFGSVKPTAPVEQPVAGGDILLEQLPPNEVAMLQQYLNTKGHNLTVDGIVGPKTQAALQAETQQPQQQQVPVQPVPVQAPAGIQMTPSAQERLRIAQEGRDIQASAEERARLKDEREAQKERDEKLGGFKNSINVADRVMSNAIKAKGQVGFWSTGIPGQALSYLWSSDSAQLKDTLTSLKSGTFMAAIKEMKQYGGGSTGLGQITNIEGEKLESMIASLSQSQKPENLKKNIQEVMEQFIRFKKAAEASINEMQGSSTKQGTGTRVWNKQLKKWETK